MVLQKHWDSNSELQLIYHAPPYAAFDLCRVPTPASVLYSAAAYGLSKVVVAEMGDPNLRISALGNVGFTAAGTALARSQTDLESGGKGVHGLLESCGSLLCPRLLPDASPTPPSAGGFVQEGVQHSGALPCWAVTLVVACVSKFVL
jgi:hypothetical protein